MPGGVLIGLLCQTSARRPTAASEAAPCGAWEAFENANSNYFPLL
jgi:hypothetical protein